MKRMMFLFLLLAALASIPVGLGAEAYDFRCRWCAMAEQARAALAAGDETETSPNYSPSREVDILHVTRTWKFLNSDAFQAQ